MGTTQPIRDRNELRQFIDYYRITEPNLRNYVLIELGLHTALRISDILQLQWKDVYHFSQGEFLNHLSLVEQKTGKQSRIALNPHIKSILAEYRFFRNPAPDDYLFTRNNNCLHPLSRSQAYRIIKKAATATSKEPQISCHSLRKTFGYHAWQQGTPPALLMEIYNHSSYRITKKYLGIEQDERDSIFLKMDF